MTTIVEFLTARYDEIEAAARAAVANAGDSIGDAGPWIVGADLNPRVNPTTVFRPSPVSPGRFVNACDTDYAGPDALDVARHIALHDPAYVLADITAKRRILAEFTQVVENGGDGDYRLEQVFKMLALPFAAHPDYDESWRS